MPRKSLKDQLESLIKTLNKHSATFLVVMTTPDGSENRQSRDLIRLFDMALIWRDGLSTDSNVPEEFWAKAHSEIRSEIASLKKSKIVNLMLLWRLGQSDPQHSFMAEVGRLKATSEMLKALHDSFEGIFVTKPRKRPTKELAT
jgi:hypothetical protein